MLEDFIVWRYIQKMIEKEKVRKTGKGNGER